MLIFLLESQSQKSALNLKKDGIQKQFAKLPLYETNL